MAENKAHPTLSRRSMAVFGLLLAGVAVIGIAAIIIPPFAQYGFLLDAIRIVVAFLLVPLFVCGGLMIYFAAFARWR